MKSFLAGFVIVLVTIYHCREASAETLDVYQWTGENGSISFTDEARRVPTGVSPVHLERYTKLPEFRRYTPIVEPVEVRREKLHSRLINLRMLRLTTEVQNDD